MCTEIAGEDQPIQKRLFQETSSSSSVVLVQSSRKVNLSSHSASLNLHYISLTITPLAWLDNLEVILYFTRHYCRFTCSLQIGDTSILFPLQRKFELNCD